MVDEAEQRTPETPATYNRRAQLWMMGLLGLVMIVMLIDTITDLMGDDEVKADTQNQPVVALDDRDFQARMASLRSTTQIQQTEVEKQEQAIDIKAMLAEERARLEKEREAAMQQLRDQLLARNKKDERIAGITLPGSGQSGLNDNGLSKWQSEETLRAQSAYRDSGLEFRIYEGGQKPAVVSSHQTDPFSPENLSKLMAMGNVSSQTNAMNPIGSLKVADNNNINEENHQSTVAAVAEKPGHLLPAGSVIHTVMNRTIRSDYLGHYSAIVARDVYDVSRRFILIPKGSKVIGEVRPLQNVNQIIQSRLGFTARWVVLPDGRKIDFASKADATDRVGTNALKDQVNNHWGWRLFGVAAYALVGTQSSYQGSGYNSDSSYAGEVGQGAREMARPLAQRFINLQPTVIIRHGQPLKLDLYDDLTIVPWSHI